MNLSRAHSLGLALLAALATAQAGEFMNLGFDSPAFPADMPSGAVRLLPEQALPGWQIDVGAYSDKSVFYRDIRIGSPGATLLENIDPHPQSKFSVKLESGGYDAHLSQNGDIPLDARSLEFKANVTHFSVSLGGQDLSLQPITGGFAADISAHAGKTEELKFTVYFDRDRPLAPQNWLYLDSIRFSPNQVIPEPSTSALLGLASSGLGWWLRRR